MRYIYGADIIPIGVLVNDPWYNDESIPCRTIDVVLTPLYRRHGCEPFTGEYFNHLAMSGLMYSRARELLSLNPFL